MKDSKYKADLENIPLRDIDRNNENPRIFFRPKELEQLFVSIREKGLLVPISVYRDGDRYVIIDGERRWKTFQKLNYPTIPAIIQDKPTELDNLLLMFNIHGLREQWDVFTIAMKIERVISLLESTKGKKVTENELSEETGMTRGLIRRAKRIISLPERFKNKLRKELEKPKNEQLYSEDFFLEMESALKSVQKYAPDAIKNLNLVRDILLSKYINDIIGNVVDFRNLVKIATAERNLGVPMKDILKALKRIFDDNDVGIEEVYQERFAQFYFDKGFKGNANVFLSRLEIIQQDDLADSQLREVLLAISKRLRFLLR